MRTKKEILEEVNGTIKTLTQPPGYRKWGKDDNEIIGEWVQPDPIEGKRAIYSKETRLIIELLVDIREILK